MLRLQVYDHIDELNEKDWDQAAPVDFYFSYTFLKVLSESKVENAIYRYLIFYENDEPAGAAVLSCFDLHLDLLTDDKAITFFKKLFPGLFIVPMICCGLPVSYGQKNFFVRNERIKAEAIAAVHKEMEQFAEETKCGLLLWKEFNPGEGIFTHLTSKNYVALPTIPDNHLFTSDADPGHFLENLRSDYRRKYREVAQLLKGTGPLWQNEAFSLQITKFAPEDVDDFYSGYKKLMARTPVKLEEYPKAFFTYMTVQQRIDVQLVTLKKHSSGKTLTGMVILDEDIFYFILISKPFAQYEGPFYRQFIQTLVLLALKKGFTKIKLGQTSYFAKFSAGTTPHRLETFILLRNKWKQKLMKKWGNKLFPEIALPKINVYQKKAASLKKETTASILIKEGARD